MSQFIWRVCDAGYRWEYLAGGVKSPPVLAAVAPWPTREYEPLLTEPALFREFADLGDDRDALIDFANRFGPLHRPPESDATKLGAERTDLKDPMSVAANSNSHGPPGNPEPVEPETPVFWAAQIAAMRSAVALWEMIRDEKADPAELGRVAGAIELGCRGRVESHFEFDGAHRECAWVRTPRDLAGALWLQFADAVAGDKQYRRCPAPGCGKWYELPRLKGPDRTHCSKACKQSAYRHRKERARELFKDGWTVDRIASEVNTPVETVNGWVADLPKPPDGEAEGTRPGLDL